MNRILFLITGSLFLLINLKLYEISKYENEDLRDIDLLLMKHPNYEGIEAVQKEIKCKKKVLKKQEKR